MSINKTISKSNAKDEYQEKLLELVAELRKHRGSFKEILTKAKISRQYLHRIMKGEVMAPKVIEIAVEVFESKKKATDKNFLELSALIGKVLKS